MDRINKLLQGSIDLHIHPDPSLMERSVDTWVAAQEASAAGMRAIIFKDHHLNTTPLAYISNKHLKYPNNFQAFGSICLNNSVGGLNPYALDAAIKLGVKQVYFPTISAAQHIKLFSSVSTRPEEFVSTRVPPMTETPITVLEENGELKAITKRIINMIADADIMLATAHLDYAETLAVVQYAKEVGIKKLVLTHLPMFTTMEKPLLQNILDVGLGIVEMTYQLLLPLTPEKYRFTPELMADYIRFFGVERVAFSTDFGHISCPKPVEGMKMSIQMLIEQGFSDSDIETMIKKNPAMLLGIDS
jgi:hypothetical protein